jgi:hypothetical protein
MKSHFIYQQFCKNILQKFIFLILHFTQKHKQTNKCSRT